MQDVVLISPPASEPVTLQEAKTQCRVYHTADDTFITDLISDARDAVECELRRTLITQTWLLKLDGFPGKDPLYESRWYPEIVLPKPPYQGLISFTYVDTAGVTQTLYECLPDGTTPTINGSQQYYGYQVDPGSETQPARLLPPWARPWPPARLKPYAVQVQFVTGYGGTITVSMTQGSGVITGARFFQTDVGKSITIPGAGTPSSSPVAPTDLVTTIDSVDTNGVPTTADVAGAAVSNVSLYWGVPIPRSIRRAILLQVAHLYENREATTAVEKKELARGVSALLGPYVNHIA